MLYASYHSLSLPTLAGGHASSHHLPAPRFVAGDCGDPLAWRPEGNCVRHVGNSDSFDPSELLNPVQRGATLATLQAVVWSFSKVVLDVCRSVSSLVHVPAPLPIRHLIPSTSGAGCVHSTFSSL